MPNYVVVHGSVKVGEKADAKHVGVGETVELTEKQAKAMDPLGHILMLPEQWESVKKQAAALAELEEKRQALGEERPLPPKLGAAVEIEKKKLMAAKAAPAVLVEKKAVEPHAAKHHAK